MDSLPSHSRQCGSLWLLQLPHLVCAYQEMFNWPGEERVASSLPKAILPCHSGASPKMYLLSYSFLFGLGMSLLGNSVV